MNIKQIEKILTDAGIEPNEAKIEAKMLLKHFLNIRDVDLVINSEFEDNFEVIEKAKLRAEKRIPIQHIIGTAYFMGEEFIVNENVLIPRDETELLVRKAVETLKQKEKEGQQELKVLDIGTGSGCIACMIAKGVNEDVKVLGVDISTDALQVALDNTSKLGLFNRALYRKSDIYSKIREKFDVIVSNPPYIPPCEKETIQEEVKYDPELALFTSDIDGIEFYEKITSGAKEFLNDGGCLIFEIGIGQAEKVKRLMGKAGFKNIEIQKDLANIDRVIWGWI